ncbi:flocculation protein FLO11-like isoform X2 [Lotus japonicus]|uniref:flocculation protein FLO11-like isoform X2 n=1 Tax=Lotus japonicus TaxID=34305 RepID=UPI002584CA5F|nr:flocculation protein FLO11-like isoform X2 [Lotus japonicus]
MGSTGDVHDRRLSIIDFASADDSLLDPTAASAAKQSPLHHQDSDNQEQPESWYTPNSKNFEDAATKVQQWEQEPLTSGAGNTKNKTKCNLRKSLAWDTAFFTSAGVLDAEELSSIIEGVEKEPLPGIEEDVYRSCDSVSTLGSDSLTLESGEIEGDLFEDVRASIQKSSTKSQLASAKTKVGSSSELPGYQTRDPSRKVGLVSRNKMKAPLASKNPSTGMQGSGKMSNKSNPVFPQLPQPIAPRRESSISKQSKIPGKLPSSTISSKRVSLDVKSEKDKAKRTVGDRVSSVPKPSIIGDSRGNAPKPGDARGNVPKPTRPSKLPSGPVRSVKTKSATSTSSASSMKPLSSSTAVRTPSRNAPRNKTEPGNSSLSGLMSSSKLSSSISPASSISDWSSESSSSFSMAKLVCNSSRSSIESTSSRKIFSDTNADQDMNSQITHSVSSIERQEAQHTGFINQSARAAPGATVVPPAPGKPSGLRLPSPKIGFFDGVKSSSRTPRGVTQSHSVPVVPRGLPKQGKGSPSDSQNKTKPGKLQTARSITSIEDIDPNNSQQNSHTNPFHESLDVAVNTSGVVQNVKSSSDMPMGTSTSNLMERTHYDLHPLKGVNNQDTAHYDYQVDCLTKQVGLIDINSETDGSFSGKSNGLGLELSSHKELFDCPAKNGLLKGSSTPGLSVSPGSFDLAASIRRPFAVKDSFCNMDGSVFAESTVVSEVKPTNLPVPESIQRENN